jgi:hypothetical protein
MPLGLQASPATCHCAVLLLCCVKAWVANTFRVSIFVGGICDIPDVTSGGQKIFGNSCDEVDIGNVPFQRCKGE